MRFQTVSIEKLALIFVLSLALQLMMNVSIQADGPDDLSNRHPDAGIWVSYAGANHLDDLRKPHIKGIMSYIPWHKIYEGPNQFNWARMDSQLDYTINQAGKKTFVAVTAGYCPNLPWPTVLSQNIAKRNTKNKQNCSPLQFWDPEYIVLYKAYIHALAEHLADFDATDNRPNQTDITFVRAQVMAETMENLPTNYHEWHWRNFAPATNGRIYKVDLNAEIAYAYLMEITLTYQRELQAAYQKRGLTPPTPVMKGGTYWSPIPDQDVYVNAGIWFDKHGASPHPRGWYFDILKRVKSRETRGTSEGYSPYSEKQLAQDTYWEILATLHAGIEFIAIYGNNKIIPKIQPKGPLGYIENQSALYLADKYAGHYRNPAQSPGAWVALRGNYPIHNWNGQIQSDTIWTNYEMLMQQYRPQDSVLLFGTKADEARNWLHFVPQVARKSRQPWHNEVEICERSFSSQECEYLHQKPTQYLGKEKGSHIYTYPLTDLGTVLYCGETAFCSNKGQTTRQETMLWARRTDKETGHNYMRFNINDTFASSMGDTVEVRVIYLDQGTGKWQLQYDSKAGVNNIAVTIQKKDSNLWKEVTVSLEDVRFSNRQEGNTDITLYNMNDDDDIFHLIEIIRIEDKSQTLGAEKLFMPWIGNP